MAEAVALLTQQKNKIVLKVVPVDAAAERILSLAQRNGIDPQQYVFGQPLGGRFPPRSLSLIAAIAYSHGAGRAAAPGTQVEVPSTLMKLAKDWPGEPKVALRSGVPSIFGNEKIGLRRIHPNEGAARWSAPSDLSVRFLLDPGVAWCKRPYHDVINVGESASEFAQEVFWAVFKEARSRVSRPERPLRILVSAKDCETFLYNIASPFVRPRCDLPEQHDPAAPPNVIIYLLANEDEVLTQAMHVQLRRYGFVVHTKCANVQAPHNFTMIVDADGEPCSLFWAAWSGGDPLNPPYQHVGAAAIAMSTIYQQFCRMLYRGHYQEFSSAALGNEALPPLSL